MKIYALDSDNENYQNLLHQISSKIPIDLFDSIDEIIEGIEATLR